MPSAWDNPAAAVPVVVSDRVALSGDEELKVVEMARRNLREKECEYRKEADRWHNLGAVETARAKAEKANTLDEAVGVLLEVEQNWQRSKNAKYG